MNSALHWMMVKNTFIFTKITFTNWTEYYYRIVAQTDETNNNTASSEIWKFRVITSSSHWAQSGQILSIAPDKDGQWYTAGDNRYITIERTEGNLGIGLTPTTGKGRLQVAGNARVDGTIYCKELRVKTNVWADYVFADDYKMKSLKEVERFISENKHLPGIPSEKEVIENGVNVVEMQTKMLKTMEEMTLHMIALKKENDLLTEKLHRLEAFVVKE